MNLKIIYLTVISTFLFSCEDDYESIIIATDKSLYNGNESVIVTIRNDSSASIWIKACPQYTFERMKGESWTNIYIWTCAGIVVYKEIAPGELLRIDSDLNTIETSETISDGNFRYRFSLWEIEHNYGIDGFRRLYDLTTEKFAIKLDDIPLGSYRYTGFDSLRTAIVSGWLSFDNEDSTQLSGEWSLDAIGSPHDIGPQTGTGTLTGGRDNGAVWIDLNPGWADNNVFLAGAFKDDGVNKLFTGKWNYSGFPGVLNQGTFSSIKEK